MRFKVLCYKRKKNAYHIVLENGKTIDISHNDMQNINKFIDVGDEGLLLHDINGRVKLVINEETVHIPSKALTIYDFTKDSSCMGKQS